MGRPSKRTPEIIDEIIRRVSEGEPLAVICREENMPDRSTFHDWRNADEELSQRFARARDEGFDALATQCLDIADDERHDWKMTQKGTITDEVAIGRAKLQVDTRLKLLSKWDPKRYGDRIAQEISGPDGGPVRTERVFSSDKEKEDYAAMIAAAFPRS
jgi:hypothetical protein